MATIELRKRDDGSSSYRARIRLKQNGVIVHEESETFDARVFKRRDVELWALRREAELSKPGALEGMQGLRITLAQAIQRYQKEFGGRDAWGRSKTSDLARLVKTVIATKSLGSIRPGDLVEHVQVRRREGAGAATAGNDLVWIRVLYKTARAAWHLPLDVRVVDDAVELCRQQRLIARAKERERRPTLDELERILAWLGERTRAEIPMDEIVLFALFSTRREAEICELKREDYDAKRGDIVVRNAKDPRGKGRDRRVGLTPEAKIILERQPAGDLYFPYNPKSIQSAFTRACQVLGIENLRFHDLRHEGTSRLFELGWTIPQVATVTGHRSWQNLKRYTHLQGHKPVDKYKGWKWLPIRRGSARSAGARARGTRRDA